MTAEMLHRPSSIDLRDDNIPLLGRGAAFHDHHIARHDPGLAPEITCNLEQIHRFLVPDQPHIETHGIAQRFFGGDGKSVATASRARNVSCDVAMETVLVKRTKSEYIEPSIRSPHGFAKG